MTVSESHTICDFFLTCLSLINSICQYISLPAACGWSFTLHPLHCRTILRMRRMRLGRTSRRISGARRSRKGSTISVMSWRTRRIRRMAYEECERRTKATQRLETQHLLTPKATVVPNVLIAYTSRHKGTYVYMYIYIYSVTTHSLQNDLNRLFFIIWATSLNNIKQVTSELFCATSLPRYQSLLNEIESSTPDAVKRHSGHARGNSIISAEDTGSLSRSNSDESNIHNNSGTHPHHVHHGHQHPPSGKGYRSKHIASNSSGKNSKSSNGHHILQGHGGMLNSHATHGTTNGHASSNSGMMHNRSSSSSSATSSNPATPNTPHAPLSPINSLACPSTHTVHSVTTKASASPEPLQCVPHGMSTTELHCGLFSAGGGISGECHLSNEGDTLSPSNLTGGHSIPPIEEEGRLDQKTCTRTAASDRTAEE